MGAAMLALPAPAALLALPAPPIGEASAPTAGSELPAPAMAAVAEPEVPVPAMAAAAGPTACPAAETSDTDGSSSDSFIR